MRNHKEMISTAVPTTWGSSMQELTANCHSSLTGSRPQPTLRRAVFLGRHMSSGIRPGKIAVVLSCQGAVTSLTLSPTMLPLPLMRERWPGSNPTPPLSTHLSTSPHLRRRMFSRCSHRASAPLPPFLLKLTSITVGSFWKGLTFDCLEIKTSPYYFNLF